MITEMRPSVVTITDRAGILVMDGRRFSLESFEERSPGVFILHKVEELHDDGRVDQLGTVRLIAPPTVSLVIEPKKTLDEAITDLARMKEAVSTVLKVNTDLDNQLEEMRKRKDQAYEERNRLVALLCALFPSRRYRTDIPGWSDDWHGCVMVHIPGAGQCTWHYHDSQAHLFAHVPELSPHDMFGETWVYDGHTTEEKYERIARACMGVDDGTSD